jgi:hypothetical protein
MQVVRDGFSEPILSLEPKRTAAPSGAWDQGEWDTTLVVGASSRGNADFRMSDGTKGYTLRANGESDKFEVCVDCCLFNVLVVPL